MPINTNVMNYMVSKLVIPNIGNQLEAFRLFAGNLTKNELLNRAPYLYAQSGVKVFPNADGTLRVTDTAWARLNFVINPNVNITRDMILSGCPAGGSSSTYKLQIVSNADQNVYADDTGSGVTVNAEQFSGSCKVQLVVYNGTQFGTDGKIFSPMLRDATISDDTYVPHIDKLKNVIDDIISKSVPEGGTAGQILVKNSGTDNDVKWATAWTVQDGVATFNS